MKNFIALAGLLAVVVLIFVRCNSEDGFFAGGGTSGVATVYLVDGNGNPVDGGTLWIPQSQFTTFQKLGHSLVGLQNGACPDPLTTPGTTLDGEEASDCLIDGTTEVPCNNGTYEASTADAAANPMSNVTVICGAVNNVAVPEIAASPSPSPTP